MQKMWNPLLVEEFRLCIADLIQQPSIQTMDQIKQHVKNVSCLDHCIFVSYLSFSLCKKLRLNASAAARAGLLHDLYLCNWSQTNIGPWKRLRIHPQIALRNAEAHGLSNLERDIIAKHMWPLTVIPPQCREAWIVTMADKYCSLLETMKIHKEHVRYMPMKTENVAIHERQGIAV